MPRVLWPRANASPPERASQWPTVFARLFPCAPAHPAAHRRSIALVTEKEIVAAMRLLWERLKLVVEPSGAVAAAPALFRQIRAKGKKVGIILSGGNLDLDTLPFGRER